MAASSSLRLGPVLFKGLLLGALAGLVWACIETGRNPKDLLRLFSGKTEPEAAPAPAGRETSRPAPEAAVKKAPPAPAPAPHPAPAPAEVKPPPAPRTRFYSASEMNSLFTTLDDQILRGRFFEAKQKLDSTAKAMIPEDYAGRVHSYEERVVRYHTLLLETTKGGTIEMPELAQIRIKRAGKLVVKLLGEDKDSYFYETITGIRSKIGKDRVEELNKLDRLYSGAEIAIELKKQASYKGILVEGEPGQPPVYRDQPGKKATGIQFFDLADFCARNGANDKLKALFDEAMTRDPNLLQTVHEVKAERMVEVLIYFLLIRSSQDARITLDILNQRYADTQAFRDKVASDPDVQARIEMVLKKGPVAAAPKAQPAPAATPSPEPSATPAPAPAPSPARPDAEKATDAPPAVAAPPLPEGTSDRVGALVAKGDRYFEEAMRHVHNSDPNINPEGWASENTKALELFRKANDEGFVPAQDLFKDNSQIPSSLLQRVREATMLASMCRKRSVRK